MRKASSAAGLAVACLLSTASIALAADPGTEDPNNWPQYNRTANAWRYSPLDQINKDNVGKLSVAWIAHGGDITMGLQETPIVIDGVIYSISIADGREKNGIRMPAWREVLSDQEIWQTTAYVLSISPSKH